MPHKYLDVSHQSFAVPANKPWTNSRLHPLSKSTQRHVPSHFYGDWTSQEQLVNPWTCPKHMKWIIPSHILPHFRSFIWVWWKWINKLKSQLNYLLSVWTSCSRSFFYHFLLLLSFLLTIWLLQSTLTLQTPRYYGHLIIADRRKKWLKLTPVITDSRYYGNVENFMPPSATIHLFFLSL